MASSAIYPAHFEVNLDKVPPADGKSRVRIVCVSDTHNKFKPEILPPADILLHCGDWTNKSTPDEVEDFNRCLGLANQFTHRIVICGNHESRLAARMDAQAIRAELSNATLYLEHECAEVMGIRIFGSPFTNHGGDRFQVQLGDGMADKWADIPDDVDILMTHMPCLGILDNAWGKADTTYPDAAGYHLKGMEQPGFSHCMFCDKVHEGFSHWGCDELLFRIHGTRVPHPRLPRQLASNGDEWRGSQINASRQPLRPKVHVCGHVHDAHGVVLHQGTWHVNAAWDLCPEPVVFDVLFDQQPRHASSHSQEQPHRNVEDHKSASAHKQPQQEAAKQQELQKQTSSNSNSCQIS